MDLLVYGTRVNDGIPAVVLVDRALRPDRARPMLWMARTPIADPLADGTAGPDEMDALWEVAAALAEAARAGDHALPAGAIVSDGIALFCFYGAESGDAGDPPAWLTAATTACAGREWECESQPDPEWDVFTGVLLPADGEVPA